jgi:putative membrane protein
MFEPRHFEHHSRWPIFLRFDGSITPDMILPLLFVAAWSSAITYISTYIHDLGFKSILLTATGFVVALALNFRSTTAHERFYEGSKY